MAAHELGKGRRQTRWGHETHPHNPHNPHNPRNLRRHSTFLSTSSSSSLSASEDFEAEYEVEVEYKNKPKPKSRAQKRRLPLPLPLKESGYSTDDYSDGIGIRYNSDDFSPAEPWTRYHSQDDALQVDIAANELQHRRRHDPSRGLKATSHETDDHDSSQITGRSHARDCSYGSRNRRTVSLSREAKVMVSRRFRTTTLLVMFLTAVLLGILSVPPALLHQVVKAHEPIPVPVVATLDKASKSLCHILALTDTPRRKYLSNKHYSQEQLEQRRYRQHLRPHSLVAYIEGAGSANVAFCNHVRAHWHQEWRRERRREDGPCFRTGLGPLQQEDDKFYHPETEGRSYTGYDDFDEYKKRDDDDEDYDINESISPLCTQELQNRYVIPGLDVHDMRRLSRTCRPWTDESLARVKYQVQQVHTVAKSTTKDVVKIVSQLYVSLPGSHWPSLPPSSQIAESTLRSLNTMISFYIQDGDPIYEDELQEFDDAFYNRPIGDRRSTGRRRHVRKNRQASRRAFRTWERYNLGSLLRLQATVANASQAVSLIHDTGPDLVASIDQVLSLCPYAYAKKFSPGSRWRQLCDHAEVAAKAATVARSDSKTRTAPAPGQQQWQTLHAVTEELGQVTQSLESLRCGFGLALAVFRNRGFRSSSPVQWADSEYGRITLAPKEQNYKVPDSPGGRLTKISIRAETPSEGAQEVGEMYSWEECSATSMWQHLLDFHHHTDHFAGFERPENGPDLPRPWTWKFFWTWLRVTTIFRECTLCSALFPYLGRWPSIEQVIRAVPEDVGLSRRLLQDLRMRTESCWHGE